MRSSKMEAEQKQVSCMLASVSNQAIASGLHYVESVRFAVGVHEVPPHLCALAVTYRPCSMQRGSEV